MNDKFGELCKAINTNARHQQDLVQSSQGISRSIPAGTHASTPHLTKTIIEIPVKEATKKGYSVARGGVRQRQLLSAGKQNKKRKSRGRYDAHIRHRM